MAWQALPRLIDKDSCPPMAKRLGPEPPRLPCVGSHVGEVPGAETKNAECNRSETVLQTIWNDLPDEGISLLSSCNISTLQIYEKLNTLSRRLTKIIH